MFRCKRVGAMALAKQCVAQQSLPLCSAACAFGTQQPPSKGALGNSSGLGQKCRWAWGWKQQAPSTCTGAQTAYSSPCAVVGASNANAK